MDQDNATTIGTNITSLGHKAWTAYVPLALWALVLVPIIIGVGFNISATVGLLVMTLVVAFLAYNILLIRSFHLYYDDAGVWIFSGVLPWKKGTRGVKWRDIDEAVMFQTLWSWMFKSFTIRVGHRFTKSAEIVITHVAAGDKSVMHINELHIEKVRANALN